MIGVVARLVADFFADLNHPGILVRFALAHELAIAVVKNQNLQSGNGPFLSTRLKSSAPRRLQRFGQGRADFVLLLAGEHVD